MARIVFWWILTVWILSVYQIEAKGSSPRHKHNKDARRFLIGHLAGAKNSSSGPSGAWPSVFNLVTSAKIEVNATCGQDGREEYCKELNSPRGRSGHCGICDDNSPDPNKRHPIQYAIDGNNDHWWQSPSLARGPEFEFVTVTLDLGQVYEVAHVIVRAGASPRPAAWVLEHSEDEDYFEPWQYFARSNSECQDLFGLPATQGKPKPSETPICTTFYSKLNPTENGEIHVSLFNNDNEWNKARFIRLRLIGLHKTDQGRPEKQFYTIKDITIGGRCDCSGHANFCTLNIDKGYRKCDCIHHTCGPKCDKCCPMFNQLPFSKGTLNDPHICQGCECHGHSNECVYDQEIDKQGRSIDVHRQFRGGGVCLNCRRHTAGINCELCEFGYYRPPGIFIDDEEPCAKCDCDPVGSTGQCHYADFIDDIICECKTGYSGSRCELCEIGYTGYPYCEMCPCDQSGTLDMENCFDECKCKTYVEGLKCDKCKEGYFSLNKNNPDGCIPCYCSGISTTCQTAIIENRVFQTLSNWTVTDITATTSVIPTLEPSTGWLTVANFELPGIESYYWNAPELYLGNKLEAYGSILIFKVGWIVVRGDTSGKPTTGPNVIIVGQNGMKIAYDDIMYPQAMEDFEIAIPLYEYMWYHVLDSVKDIITTRSKRTEYKGEMVTRKQFLNVLTNIKYLLLRAKFHTDQAECSLEGVLMIVGNEASMKYSMKVEECLCPPGYTGLSCELCDFSYMKVLTNTSNHFEKFECVRCNCNGHAETCDLDIGKCSKCEHNTMGEKCERCASGYYGNPLIGTEDDCKRCACPLLIDSNNFSPSCALEGTDGDKYFCTQCPEGYTGDHCEICDYGFFGEPNKVGSTCEICQCNGAPCDNITGECLSCPGNTDGPKCENCKEDHYGIPSEKDCKPCDCDIVGSESFTCHPGSGKCTCKPRYAGRACNACEEGYGNFTDGCIPCSCNEIGSLSLNCDPISGQCLCKPGVEGFNCDTCKHLHYDFSTFGCQSCKCNKFGSENSKCHIATGMCLCLPHVVGHFCDTCEVGYWHLESGKGCKKCECDPLGTENNVCDQLTGECRCRPGVGGKSCETCLPGYYGFSSNGCLRCEECSIGKICDPDTGRCICPTLSQGITCNECRPGSWGLDPFKGCKFCNCSLKGSIKTKCDPVDGHCLCREGFDGLRCDTCAPMYFGYPHCRPCACHYPGTNPQVCDKNGQCTCDENGQCPCKANVIGKKCDQCLDGTFGLSLDSPSGCTQCFCFGRTSHCTEAGLTWGHVRLNTPRVLNIKPSLRPNGYNSIINRLSIEKIGGETLDFYSENEDTELNVSAGLTIIPETEGNITIETNYDLSNPLYWSLPTNFLGDKVTSYGGFLKFSVNSSSDAEKIPDYLLKQYPLVQIHAHDLLILEYHEILPPDNGIHAVRFHESLWTYRNSKVASMRPLNVDRSTLMVALQNLDGIYIRGTEYINPTTATLTDVSMDSAIPIRGHPGPLASSVELCSCPYQYNSTSCQDASFGFYIPTKRHPSNATGTIIIQLITEAEPCQCNGRSESCDKNTGYCTNCTENSGGRHCDQCAEGYYGDPQDRNGCLPCRCPHYARNNAASCQIRSGRFLCVCKEGYRGADCSICDSGWWMGNDGKCRRCECNSGGTIWPVGGNQMNCHPTTGQCDCHRHVSGMKCDLCNSPRHYLEGSVCKPCDNCTQTLLDQMELMLYELDKDMSLLKNNTIPSPWNSLHKISNQTANLKTKLNNLLKLIDTVTNLPVEYSLHINDKGRKIINDYKKINDKWKEKIVDGKQLIQRSKLIFDELIEIRKKLESKIQELEDFSRPDKHFNINKVIKEGRHILNKIKELNLAHHTQKVDEIFSQANFQSTVVEENAYKLTDHGNKLSKLIDDFKTLQNDTNDIIKFIDHTTETIGKVVRRNHFHKLKKDALQNTIKEKSDYDFTKSLDQCDDLNKRSSVLLDESLDNIDNLKVLTPKLKSLVNNTRISEEILARLNYEYEMKYLNPVKDHVENLTKVSSEYQRLLTIIAQNSDAPFKASTAFQNIVDSIKSAEDAGIEALDAARLANLTLIKDPIHGNATSSLLSKSKHAKNKSNKLYNNVKTQSARLQDIVSNLERLKEVLEVNVHLIRGVGTNDNNLRLLIGNLSNQNYLENVKIATDKTRRVFESIKFLHKEVSAINKNITYNLKKRLSHLQSQGDDKIGGAEENVSEIRGNVRKASELVANLQNASKMRELEISIANVTLGAKLQLLKDRIQTAFHIASGIKVAMKSNSTKNKCSRSYHLLNLAPSTTTDLEVLVSLSPDYAMEVPFVVFYLASSNTGDFIQLEIINGKARFTWNLGNGTTFIEHPETLEINNRIIPDNIWYKIIVKRVWNVAKIWMERILIEDYADSDDFKSTILSVPSTGSSNPSNGVLNVKCGDLVWVGDRKNYAENPSGLGGSIDKLYYNGKHIPFWNFHSQPSTAICDGAFDGPDNFKTADQNMYYWNGYGYSIMNAVDQQLNNKLKFSISLTFRTLDENALLFLVVDKNNNRSIQLQLREGRVVFRIKYGGESQLEINTTEKYNTGKLVKVQAARFFGNKIENGNLKVDDSVNIGSPNPPVINSASLPDLSESRYMLGGTEPHWKPPSFLGVLPPPFLGCLGDINIDADIFNPTDTTLYYGIENSCANKPLTSVGFYGDGYIELPSHTLEKKSAFGFMFRTLQPDSFLLLSAPYQYYLRHGDDSTVSEVDLIDDLLKENHGFYSISLINGKIHLLMNAGKDSLKLVSNTSELNDGHFHSVNVIKNNRKIELHIDESFNVGNSLPHGSLQRINSITPSLNKKITGGLFLGGFPASLNDSDITNQYVASTIPLRGAIKELVFDGEITIMNDVVQMHHASIGRLGPSMGEEIEIGTLRTEESPSDSTPAGCYKVNSYSLEPGAVKFGDKQNSYAQVQFIGKNIWHRNLMVKFDFRTFYPNGLLLVSLGNKQHDPHLISLFLRNGKVTLLIKGNKKREKVIQLTVNDGLWHHVNLILYKKKISMSIGSKNIMMRMPKKLSVSNMFYVGGIPKNTPYSIPNLISKIEGLKGCVRKMIVDNKPEDLVKDATLHQNVGQCFPVIEKGSYFAGDAYAIYNNNFEIGPYLELNLEFRTVEMNGILLSVAHARSHTPAISLELHNAKIATSVLTASGRHFNVETSLPTKFGLCDNTWHRISVLFSNKELTVRVDDEQEKIDAGYTIAFRQTMPPSINQPVPYAPLYIGGLPDGAPTGTLKTKDNFKGCIRLISVEGRVKDWTDMDHMHNILLNSCPVK